MKRLLFAAFALLLIWGCACASGVDVDEEGGVWDYNTGIYTAPDGTQHSIENSDSSPTSSYEVPVNPDGGMTVESGQFQMDEASSGEGAHLTEEEYAARRAKYTARNGTTTGTVYVNEAGDVFTAEILSLGLGRSTIRVEGEDFLVPTSSLSWDTDAPEDKLLAVVTLHNNPKLTYLTLRAKKKQGSFVLGNCTKRRVLRVISTGKTWTMVDDDGIRGYVLTSGLTFYDNKPRQYAAGILTVKGKLVKGNTIHARTSTANDPGYVRYGDGREMAEFPVGTPVTVFAQDEKWSELDVGGWHCFILNEFVTLQEPLPAPAPDAGEAGASADEPGGPDEDSELSPEPPQEDSGEKPEPKPAAPEAPALQAEPAPQDPVEMSDRPNPPV